MEETSNRLVKAAEQHQALAQAAQKNGAQGAGDSQGNVADALQEENDSIRGAGGNPKDLPELAKPHLVVSSPAGIVTTATVDTHIVSDRHTAITTGKSFSLAAGTNLFASVRQAFRLFVQQAGIKMVAAAGDIDVQALSDSIKVLAKLDITQSANRITISAKEELVINGGGSFAKFTAGSIELGTSGTFTAHAATHSLPGPKSLSVNNALTAANIGTLIAPGQLPKELVESSAWVEFKLVNADGPIPSEKYILTDPDGGKHTGNVDDQGGARIDRIPSGRCKVEFPNLSYSVEVGTT
jgi:type VI secretion system secreted protein VgrG